MFPGMTDIPHQDLIDEIEAFCAARGMTVTRFGRDAVNDPALVQTLRAGRDLRMSTFRRIRAFLTAAPQAAE